MNAEQLAKAGQALYGERWQSPLARDLEVSDRTVRRWAAGDNPVPEEVERRIRTLLQQVVARLRKIERVLGL